MFQSSPGEIVARVDVEVLTSNLFDILDIDPCIDVYSSPLYGLQRKQSKYLYRKTW